MASVKRAGKAGSSMRRRGRDGVTTLSIDASSAGEVVSALLAGHNLEHTRRCIHGGLSAEMLRNRKFTFQPGPQGVALPWQGVGHEACQYRLLSGADAYVRHEGIDLYSRFKSDYSVQYQAIQAGPGSAGKNAEPCGITQGGLRLRRGLMYRCFVAVRADRAMRVTVTIASGNGRRTHGRHVFAVKSGQWRELEFSFRCPANDDNAALSITFPPPGTLHVGAVSLLPANTFHGLRQDVIDKLREISAPILRWPGGNFSGDYRWKEGLLPVHQRAPLKAYMDDTLWLTGGYDTHEIGVDEYIALCRQLGAEPFITVNINRETAQDAADFVEYCNGAPSTRWGKLRARRGNRQPYGVKYWSIGNEVGYGHMPPPNEPDEYCRLAHEYAKVMRKVDPSVELVAAGTWFSGWVPKIPSSSYRDYEHVSFHWYARPETQDFLGPKAPDGFRQLTHMPDTDYRRLAELRQSLDQRKPRNRRIGIAYDEWNVWYAWDRRPTIVDGIYAAGTLHMLFRNAQALDLSIGAYFQPVNEGAIVTDAGPNKDQCELTPVGQVMAMLKVHHGGRLIELPFAAGSDIDALATLAPGGKAVHVTLINREPQQARKVVLDLRACRPQPGDGASTSPRATSCTPYSPELVTLTQLVPVSAEPCVRFTEERSVSRATGGTLALILDPLTVTHLDVPCLGAIG